MQDSSQKTSNTSGSVDPAGGSAAPDVERQQPTENEGKNPAAVALGRLGGLKGGKARALKLTAQQRQEIARKAAEARWNKDDDSQAVHTGSDG